MEMPKATGTLWIKRAFDIAASALGMVVLSPLMLAIAAAVRCSSAGPVVFRQKRLGRGGKPFTIYKFRSMVVNPESETGWAKWDDPRQTRVGAFLRRHNLDELPQLFNVLNGTMSLVGPRPERPYFAARFQAEIPGYGARLAMRPGMTGFAQVNGLRGDTSIEKRTECDLWYIENWSLGLDARIMLKTLFGDIDDNDRTKERWDRP